MKTFAENLDAILKKRSLTGEWLSGQTGIDPSDISKYRNGKKSYGLDTIKSIAKALGVAVVALDESLGEAPPDVNMSAFDPVGADTGVFSGFAAVPASMTKEDAEDILKWYGLHKRERREFLAKIGGPPLPSEDMEGAGGHEAKVAEGRSEYKAG